ncbi:heme ABC transporter ATP-binding protein [Anaerolineaceae bacterium oral taxon 439]|nr:heme ABC transporter ATP-binding protein [Anaerolineaceae bacterium oral taxon 439]
MKQPVIQFKNFSFHYTAQAKPTLKDINLTVYAGEKILILGPSGSGKSTLGHCVNGLAPHYYKGKITGTIEIQGSVANDTVIYDRSKMIGTVLQDSDGQFVGQTVGEDIAFSLENDCVPQSEMIPRVEAVARLVDIDHHLKSTPQEVSGGQKQRVALAGVLIDNVDILLFDEPLANLDPATGQYAIELIDRLAQDESKTILIIEHRLEDVLWRGIDRIFLMDHGTVIADDTPDRILASGMLREYGIREPLYLTALRYAGVPVTPELRPASVAKLPIEKIREPIQRWYRSINVPQTSEEKEEILTFDDVSFAYNDTREVLKEINFTIHKGEMIAIVGKNGAGKSTLCKLICGFEKPTSGEIRLRGKSLKDVSIRRRADSIGYVMQNPNQMLSKVLIREEVGLGLKLRDVEKQEIDRRVDEVLKICGLYPFRNWPVSALSYGQKKRVTIAAILVLEPDVLLLDEPTAGQDFRHYTEIMEFLVDLQRRGLTIVMVTHDMHLMLEYTERAIVIADGKLICDELPSRVLTDGDVIRKANLKETSLLTIAKASGIADPIRFVQRFIDFDREEREKWRLKTTC